MLGKISHVSQGRWVHKEKNDTCIRLLCTFQERRIVELKNSWLVAGFVDLLLLVCRRQQHQEL